MEFLARTLHALLPVAWTLAAAAYAWVFLKDDEDAARLATPLATAAAALHVVAFGAVALAGLPPVASAGGLLSGVGLSIVAVYLWLERRIGTRSTGVFPVGLAALLCAAAAATGDPLRPVSRALMSWNTAGHVATAVLGYSGLLLGAIFGALYLVQRRALKARSFGLFWERLPSVELLDAFCRRSLVAAFLFLTVTIGLGHLARAAHSPGAYWDAKVVATNGLWLLVGLVWPARALGWLRPSASAVASIVLFGLAVVNMLVVDPMSAMHRAY